MAEFEIETSGKKPDRRCFIYYLPGNRNYVVELKEYDYGDDEDDWIGYSVSINYNSNEVEKELPALIAALTEAQRIASEWAAEGSAS
jgi:hypothetical protein